MDLSVDNIVRLATGVDTGFTSNLPHLPEKRGPTAHGYNLSARSTEALNGRHSAPSRWRKHASNL